MSGASPLYNTFARIPLTFERGEGVWLITDKGERYLDFAAGIAVNSLGHAHPHLVEALKEQAEKLWHVSNLYGVSGQEKLAERLTAVTFADKAFFSIPAPRLSRRRSRPRGAIIMPRVIRRRSISSPSKARSMAVRLQRSQPAGRRNIWKVSDRRRRALSRYLLAISRF